MTCNVCGRPLESSEDFERGWCVKHEHTADYIVQGSTAYFFSVPIYWCRRILGAAEMRRDTA